MNPPILSIAALALTVLAGCATDGKLRAGATADRVMLASEAKADARARNDDGSWTNPDPIASSRYRKVHPDHCRADARGVACTDQAPIEVMPGAGVEWQGHVAIAFAALADGSRCFGEARKGTPRSENILVVRGYPGANGTIPRARSLGRIAGTGDRLSWAQVADPAAFLELCHRMGPVAGAAGRIS